MDNNEFISVEVRNPRTHLKRRWTSFTDYEIVISTNSMAFSLQQSKVRRRFSEFEWLRTTLAKNSSISTFPPPLPNKKVLGRFNQDFLEKRRTALQEFMTKVINKPTHLSELAVHLFLQSSLTTREIERVLEGKDRRDVAELIFQEKKLNDRLTRKGSEVTNADSGFSGSNNLDGHIPDCILQCQGLGNGWSSGCTNMLDSSSDKKKPCKACRRKSLPHHAASVLPTGQLLIADDVQVSASKNDSDAGSISSSDRCPEENCAKCNQYDADDETDTNVVDYDIINTKTFRLRDWLSKVTPASDSEWESTDKDNDSLPPSLSCSIPEYDVISVPCSSTSVNNASLRRSYNLSDDGTCEYRSSSGSQYSVVHSTIDGLKLESYKLMCSSTSTLSSAGIYRTYDVVEMVELN